MLTANTSLLSSESAADMRANAMNYHSQKAPPKVAGNYYFAAVNDVVGLVSGPLCVEGEFIATDAELTEAQSRQTGPVYDTRSGAKHVYANSAWSIHATQTLWTDIDVGRIVYNPTTYAAYFIAGVGNALPL